MESAIIGKKLRELRLARGVRQSDLARRLEISPAYLNLLEKGRRAMQFPLLLRALDALSVELDAFMGGIEQHQPDDVLAHLLDDPLTETLGIAELAGQPSEQKAASTIAALFHLYKNTRAQLDKAISRLEEGGRLPLGYAPGDEVSDFLESNRNYFPELEELAAQIRRDAALPRRFVSEQLAGVLGKRFGIDVSIAPPRSASSVVRSFDADARRLVVTSQIPEQRLKFQLAHVVGLLLLDETGVAADYAARARPRHGETARLIKIHLANYFAGALLLPYQEFFDEVQRTRYDIERIATAFESSYETVAHRTCNLADPARPGVPLHFLRVDVAGNISKRYSASGLRFPQSHGSCPKWAVHAAFLTPATITRQYSRMPDGTTYFCFAKVISEPEAGSVIRGTTYAIGLGTRAENARQFVYADDLPSPDQGAIAAGITCRFCERADCNQRAAPSYKFAFAVDEYIKKDNFFSPLTGADTRDRER